MSKNISRLIVFLLGIGVLLLSSQVAFAQLTIPIECGAIVEAETTSETPFQEYQLQVQAGTILNLSVEPIGTTLNLYLMFEDSGGNQFAARNDKLLGGAEEFMAYQVSSSNPILYVTGTEPNYSFATLQKNDPYFGKHFGAYTINLGCTLRDGTVINPGDALSDTTSSGTTSNVPTAPTFSGVGFPGLAPVDFANAAKLPLPAGIAMSGGVTPTGSEILGYTLDAAPGDILDLTFTRLSGNLNLGLVVLSADNHVVFQASLITSTTLNTRFTLPSAGQYTIGIFRIDLLPPAAPEATAFQVQGTLNP